MTLCKDHIANFSLPLSSLQPQHERSWQPHTPQNAPADAHIVARIRLTLPALQSVRPCQQGAAPA